jgi:SH3 domain protein
MQWFMYGGGVLGVGLLLGLVLPHLVPSRRPDNSSRLILPYLFFAR